MINLDLQHENRTFVLKPTVLKEADLVLDEVHSFVLRISVSRAHGGKGKPRPQFHLVHVNSGFTSRMKSTEEVLEQLSTQITRVLDGFEFQRDY